jgi:MFS transporter, DHA1 family, inner membrane transport protein
MNFIAALCIAGFAAAISARSVDPMLPAIAQDFTISLRQAALLASAYSIPYALTQLALGPLGDVVGKSRLIRFSLAALSAMLFVSAVAPRFDLVLIARMVSGAFAGGIIPVAFALIGDRTTLAERQISLSRVLIASMMGQVIGAAAAGMLASLVSWRAMFWVGGVVAAIAFFCTLPFLKSSDEVKSTLSIHRAFASYGALLADPAALLVFGAVAAEGILCYGAFPFVAPMLITHGASGPFEAGIALAAFAVGGVAYGLVLRPLLRLLGQWTMMRVGGVILGIAYGAAALPGSWLIVPPLFLVAGFGFFMVHNSLQTRATELAPGARGATFALFSAAISGGMGVGPIIAGAVAEQAGFPPLFIGAGVLLTALAFATSTALKRVTARGVDTLRLPP